MRKAFSIGIFIAIVVLAVIGNTNLYSTNVHEPSTPAGWQSYRNNTYGIAFSYPSSLLLATSSTHGYFSATVSDGKTHAIYLSISVPDDRAEAERTLVDYLTGPYPKTIPASGISGARTVVQRTLNGSLKGIEFYGSDGEGGSYSDSFIYIGTTHLYLVALDPLLESRITAYGELGRQAPEKDIYDKIISSLQITDPPGVVVLPLTDGTQIPWLGTYHEASATNGMKSFVSTTLGVSFKYPSDYLLFTNGNAAMRSVVLSPASSTLQTIARANAGFYGEAPGTITLSFFFDFGGETLATLPSWLGANSNYSNFDPTVDPATALASTTVARLAAFSYRTSLGLYGFEYRAFIRNGNPILISAADIPEVDFDTVLNSLSLTP